MRSQFSLIVSIAARLLCMEVINSTKDATDTEQQSYFYVVWPEEKSPRGAAVTTLCNSAVTTGTTNSTPSSSSTLPTFSYEAQPQTLASGGSSGSSSSSSIQQIQSPAGSPLSSREAMRMASPQLLTQDNCAKKHSDGIPVNSMKPQLGAAAAAVPGPCNSPNSSIGKHRTLDLSHNNRKVLYHPTNSFGDSNLREIDILAKQAIINLQKIVIATGSSTINSTSANSTTNTTDDIPSAKRKCVWDQNSIGNCMECEVKDAEINILRRRIQMMQEQLEQILLPNGVKSHVSPPPEDKSSPQKPVVGQIQELPQLSEHHHLIFQQLQQQQQQLQQQQQQLQQQQLLQRGRTATISSESTSVIIQGDNQPSGQSSSNTTSKQSSDYIELVSGSGVYIPTYKLEEATRDAKTGTQLARKLMDAFWDKDTLAKSTLTPRSKFQYQQLDPKVIKSIEAYCLSHDNSLHSKDIHATMTDKCCQARSRYRIITPQMYSSE